MLFRSDIFENSDALTKEFALGFKINGDPYDKKYILYRCTVGRPAITASTTGENVEIPDETATLTAMPRENDHFIKRTIKKTSSHYDDLFNVPVLQPSSDEESSETNTEESQTEDQSGGN